MPAISAAKTPSQNCVHRPLSVSTSSPGRGIVNTGLCTARTVTFLDAPSTAKDSHDPHFPVAANLTNREREIGLLLAQGLRGSEIAEELHLSDATVRTHINNAMVKLDAHTRAHLVALVLDLYRADP